MLNASSTVLVSQLFAPTTLHVTFEREGAGSFTDEEIERVVERDPSGRVVLLHLPEKAILIANHQVRPIPLKDHHFAHSRMRRSL